MRIPEVKQIVTDAIMAERERCARIAENWADWKTNHTDAYLASEVCEWIVNEIRSANPPSITVIRPETAVQHPEKIKPGTIVAGQALIGDDIVDRKRTPGLQA